MVVLVSRFMAAGSSRAPARHYVVTARHIIPEYEGLRPERPRPHDPGLIALSGHGGMLL